MEKKPYKPKVPTFKNINRNHVTEEKKDILSIDNLYTRFTTTDYDDLLKEFDTNQIFNFKNEKGETLIHAVLRNPSSTLNEDQILQIIKLLVHHNVSVNAMNEFNQTAMHIACQSGYFGIVDYLVKLKCSTSLVDNYGNAPVHYAIDKFVYDCKFNEFYKDSNKLLKYTGSTKFIKAGNFVKNTFISAIITEYENVIPANNFFYNFFRNLVRNNRQAKMKQISAVVEESKELVNTKLSEISKLISENAPINKSIDNEIVEIINNSKESISELFKDIDIKSSVADVDIPAINFADLTFLNKYKPNIDLMRTEYDEKLKKLLDKLDDIDRVIDEIDNTYFLNIVCTYHLVYYFHTALKGPPDDDPGNNYLQDYIDRSYDDIDDLQVYDFAQQLQVDYIRSPTPVVCDFTLPPNQQHPVPYDDVLHEYSNIYNNIDLDVVDYFYNDPNNPLNPRNPPNGTHNGFVGSPVRILRDLIKLNTECIRRNIRLISSSDIDVIKFNICYSKIIYESVLNIINNVVLLANKISEISTDAIEAKLAFLEDYLGWCEANQRNKFVTIKPIYDSISQQIRGSIEKIKKQEYASAIATVYGKLVSMVTNELSSVMDQGNKIISSKFLNAFIDAVVLQPVNQTIDEFYTNNITLNSRLPSTYAEFDDKYGNDVRRLNIDASTASLLQIYNSADVNTLHINNAGATNYNCSTPDVQNMVVFDPPLGYVFRYIQQPPNPNDGYQTFQYAQQNPDFMYGRGGVYPITLAGLAVVPLVAYNNVKELMKVSLLAIFHDIDVDLLARIVPPIVPPWTGLLNGVIATVDREPALSASEKKPYASSLTKIASSEDQSKSMCYDFYLLFLEINNKFNINLETNNIVSEVVVAELLREYPNLPDVRDALSVYDKEVNDTSPTSENGKILQNIFSNDRDNMVNVISATLLELETGMVSTNYDKKIILGKCYSDTHTEKFKKIKNLNLRIEDMNGNTILNRLIDQYNVYGIKKILEMDTMKSLKTYKNSKEQTSEEYLVRIINNVRDAYSRENLNDRIDKYAEYLHNMMASNENFNELVMDTSQKFIENLVLNSLYLFTESIWLKMYELMGEWNLADITSIKSIVSPETALEEQILIKSFDASDLASLATEVGAGSLKKSIKKTISELERKLATLILQNTELGQINAHPMMSVAQVAQLQANNGAEQARVQLEIARLDSFINPIGPVPVPPWTNFVADVDGAPLVSNYSIDYSAFSTLVKDTLGAYYSKMIRILNDKNKATNYKYICNFNILLFNTDYGRLTNAELVTVNKYYKNIIDNIYADYKDLDIFEDSEYNYLNQYMINAIKLNAGSLIIYEMLNALIKYGMDEFKDAVNKQAIIDSLAPTGPSYKQLYNIAEELMDVVLYTKLEIKNPDVKYHDTDALRTTLFKRLRIIFTLPEPAEGDIDNRDNKNLKTIVDFYTFIYENVAHNTYQELVKLVTESKKMSILTEMLILLRE